MSELKSFYSSTRSRGIPFWYFTLSLVPFGSFYTDKMLKRRYAPALQRVKAS
jgi:hypothetical protein